MNTPKSSPQLIPPPVPSNFVLKGTPQEIIQSIFDLLKSSTFSGIAGSDQDGSFDIAQIQQAQATQASQILGLTKKRLFFRLDAVHNGVVVVPFGLTPMPTNDYSVNCSFIGPSGTLRGFEWAIVDESKLTNQVQIRTNASDNSISQYDIEVVVTQN